MIQNKVAESELITLDLKQFLPVENPVSFDLKDYLFKGLILKEKDFRESLKNLELESYHNKVILVFCSADVIIPVWAFMLTAATFKLIAKEIFFGNKDEWNRRELLKNIDNINIEIYKDNRIVIKGCGDVHIPEVAFFSITDKLLSVVKSLMYGEPCSTVPIYKKK
jgi:hypothetical protein